MFLSQGILAVSARGVSCAASCALAQAAGCAACSKSAKATIPCQLGIQLRSPMYKYVSLALTGFGSSRISHGFLPLQGAAVVNEKEEGDRRSNLLSPLLAACEPFVFR